MSRAVLTLAVGKAVYLDMAINLARSFRLWHAGDNIEFHIVTDRADQLPADIRFAHVRTIKPGEFGTGFSPKLHLDEFAPAEETLFVDGDCLCVRNLNFAFDAFRNHDVGVIGECRSSGEHFGDIAIRCRRFKLPWVPVFVGGIYFLRRGKTTRRVFSTARSCFAAYDEDGFVRLRGVPNEEPLIGVGLASFGQKPLRDDGTIKADAMFYYNRTRMNVLKGTALLTGGGRCPSVFWTLETPQSANPALVHFNASYAEQPPYTSETATLRKVALKWPCFAARLYAYLVTTLPFFLTSAAKALLRPIYRVLFGFRSVRTSSRT